MARISRAKCGSRSPLLSPLNRRLSATSPKETCDVRKLNYLGLLGAAASLVLLASPVRAEDKPAADSPHAVKDTPRMTTAVTSSGQPIVMPQKDVQITVSTYEIPAGAKLPEHKH